MGIEWIKHKSKIWIYSQSNGRKYIELSVVLLKNFTHFRRVFKNFKTDTYKIPYINSNMRHILTFTLKEMP